MKKNILITKKKALALLTAFLFSAGIFLAAVANVQGNRTIGEEAEERGHPAKREEENIPEGKVACQFSFRGRI